MTDPTLLPDELRQREEELKKNPPAPRKPGELLRMHVPKSEDEDIEVIEVDEGDLGDVLKGEPLLSRMLFRGQSLFGELKKGLFHPRTAEPPPKLPPQFFDQPPKEKKPPGLLPISGGATAKPAPEVPSAVAVAPAKPRVIPVAEAPRRVRVIRRVRKPVTVSFLDDATMRLQVDLPRRRFTLVLFTVLFALLFAGSFVLLGWQGERAQANAQSVTVQLADVQKRILEKQGAWSEFQTLEPRLKALGSVLNGHVLPTKIFDVLETATVPDVSYSSFTLSPDGRITLAATAGSFESAARQVVALRGSGIASAVDAMGYQATHDPETGRVERVNFQITIMLRPDAIKVRL